MKLAVAVCIVLAPGLAAAEPREWVAAGEVGVSGAAPPDAPTDTVPFSGMLGAQLSWEPALPYLVPLEPRQVFATIAPAAEVSLQGTHPMVLGGARLQLDISTGLRGGVYLWLAPQVGAISGAASLAAGGELGLMFRVRDDWRVGFIYGVYGYDQTVPTAVTARSTSPTPMPTPSAATQGILQAQLALVVGHKL